MVRRRPDGWTGRRRGPRRSRRWRRGLVAGAFYDPLETPDGPLVSRGSADGLVAWLRFDGTRVRGRGSAKTQISAWSIAAAAPAVVVVLEADGTLDIDGARSRTPVQEEARATCRSWTLSTVTTAGDGFSWVNILEIGVNVGSLKDAQHELSEKIKQRAAGFKAP